LWSNTEGQSFPSIFHCLVEEEDYATTFEFYFFWSSQRLWLYGMEETNRCQVLTFFNNRMLYFEQEFLTIIFTLIFKKTF
jgi:hypothetical protein